MNLEASFDLCLKDLERVLEAQMAEGARWTQIKVCRAPVLHAWRDPRPGPYYLGLHQVGRFLMVCALTNLASLQVCLLLHCKGDDGLVTIRAAEAIRGLVLQPSNSGGQNIPTDVPGLGEGDTESSHLSPGCMPQIAFQVCHYARVLTYDPSSVAAWPLS